MAAHVAIMPAALSASKGGVLHTRRPLGLDFARRGGHGRPEGVRGSTRPAQASKSAGLQKGDHAGFVEGQAREIDLSQLEQDAQALHEKTARLRELRLAHEAANPTAKPAPPVAAGRRKEACEVGRGEVRKSGKSAKDRGSLADWLTTQENQGRRS